MLIYDDIFVWKGWGGLFELGSGKCRLRVYDLEKRRDRAFQHLKPFVAITADIPESRMSVKSCTSHIATSVAASFNIPPSRMLYVEYYPAESYGQNNQHHIPERFEVVDFKWHEGKALHPRWRPLQQHMRDILKELMRGRGEG